MQMRVVFQQLSSDPGKETREADRGKKRDSLRIGLSHVKGLHSRTMERIIEERAASPFASLEDFLDRVAPSLPEAVALADAGALDSFGHTRPEAMWRIRLHKAGAPVTEGKGGLPRLEDIPHEEKLRLQMESMDFCATDHPLKMFPKSKAKGVTLAGNLYEARAGAVVKVAGWLVTAKRHRTNHGEFMKFLTLEDETGLVEAVLFPGVYKRFGHMIRGQGPYLVTGRLEDDGGYRTITAQKIELA